MTKSAVKAIGYNPSSMGNVHRVFCFCIAHFTFELARPGLQRGEMVYFVTDTNWMFLAFSALYVTFFIFAIPWWLHGTKPHRTWRSHYLWRTFAGPAGYAKGKASAKKKIESRCNVKGRDIFPFAWGILSFFLILDMFFFISYNQNTVLQDLSNYGVTIGVIVAPSVFPVIAAMWSYCSFKAHKGRGLWLVCGAIALVVALGMAMWGLGSSSWLIANLYGNGKAIPYSDPTYPTMAVVCFAWTLTSAWMLAALIWYFVLLGKARVYGCEESREEDCEDGSSQSMIDHPMEQQMMNAEGWLHSPRKTRSSSRHDNIISK